MYAMICTRPDLCISISILSRYQSCASEELWVCLKRILRYVKGSLNCSLVFQKGTSCDASMICGYVDSDWAGDKVDRKSTAGYVFKVFGCSVSWASKKQSSVALSTTEAEYVALSLAASEACWLQYMLKDFKLGERVKVKLFEDNQSAIKVCKSPYYHNKLKHIDIRVHFIRNKIREGNIEVVYLSSREQLGDLLTKPLGKSLFEDFRRGIGLK